MSGGTGNWDSTTNWAATSGGASGASFPVAGDVVAFDSNSGNAPITVNVASACASLVMSGTYAGTLTFTSTLTLTSTCTFVSACTIAGTAGTLILNTGSLTLTSGGKTLTCALTFGTSATYTLGDNWTVNGLVTAGNGVGTTTINQTGTNKITCAGGFHNAATSGAVAGTAKIELTGGTWDGAGGTLRNNVDLAGNVTVSGTVLYASTSTLRYVSGTITTTGSTLSLASSSTSTLDTAGVTWNNVTFGSSSTHALTSALAWSGTLTFTNSGTITVSGAALSGTGGVAFTSTATVTLNNTGGLVTTGTMTLPNASMTFAGSAGYTVATQTTATLSASRTHTLTFGNTYRVTTALGNVGTTATVRQALVSSSAGNKVVFTVTPGATLTLSNCDPTDIDSSAGGLVTSVGGVITTSLNWSGSVVAGSALGGPSFGLAGPLFRGREETMDVPLDEVVYFDGISSVATGAASDADSAPTFAVYEEATDTDIGVGGSMTKRTSLTGNYRGTFTCSAANGFELGKWYNVIGSATIAGVACKAVLWRFRIVAAELVAGYPLADAAKWLGGTISAVNVTGVPKVDVVDWLGVAPLVLSSQQVQAVVPTTQKVDVDTIKTNPVVNAGTITFPTGATLASTTNITAGTMTTVTTVTNQLTTAQITSAVWRDLFGSGNFSIAGSIGNVLATNIDDTITSRSTYGGDDTPGTTTLLGRLTSTRAGLLDNLDAAVSSRSTYAGADTAGTTTLLARLTSTRATNFDNLDALVSSRLATAGYTAPPSAATIATQVELQIMDEADTRQVLQAIVDKINATDTDLAGLSVAAITSAVAAQVTTDHGAGSYVRNTEPDNTTLTRLATTLETPGLGVYRFTTASLVNAPTGGGSGTADWTDPEKDQIRKALGVTGTAAATTGAGLLDLVKAKMDTLGAGQVTVSSPVSVAGDRVELRRGDDYLAADGRALDFSATGWPDLTGGTVAFVLHGVSRAGSIPVHGSGSQTVRWEPTAAVTLTLRSGTVYAVATLADGDVVTLLSARVDVS